MSHRELAWKTNDGVDIFGQVWQPEVIPARAVVCLVHGLGEHSSRYAHVAEALNKEGFIFFASDLRGHGRSGGKRGHFLSMKTVEQDMDLLLAHAASEFPGLPTFLYGHSLGATFVLYYCLKRNPRINGVVATGAPMHTTLEDQKIKLMMAKIMGGLLPNVSLASGLNPNHLSRSREVVQAYIEDPLVHDKGALGFAKITIFETHPWVLQHAAEFPLPLLLMHGKNDLIALPSSSIEFAAALGDKCTLVLWEDCYHEIHNEPDQDEVFKTMILWMNARLAE